MNQTSLWGFFAKIDWIMVSAALLLSAAGLITMNSFGSGNYFFDKQLASLVVVFCIGIMLTRLDSRFLRRTSVVVSIYALVAGFLALLFIVGTLAKGAQSWFSFGLFSIQPAEFAKLVLIIVLAKYFARRHVEIAYFKHIIVSGLYAFILFVLVALQPDFGTAIIIFLIWFGMVLVSGLSKKHVFAVFLIGLISFGMMWGFVFKDYQKQRIMTFIHPLADIHGAGYNAYQSTVAVGSGQVWGKGIGYGTQSKLQFLPEYQTDFIFAAFAEEWGFVGVLLFFIIFGILFWRILVHARRGETNFESLFCMGYAVFLLAHFIIHVGMNIGLLPVTGITMPFASYGGSHLLTEWIGLGIIMGFSNRERIASRGSFEKTASFEDGLPTGMN